MSSCFAAIVDLPVLHADEREPRNWSRLALVRYGFVRELVGRWSAPLSRGSLFLSPPLLYIHQREDVIINDVSKMT